MYLYFFNDPWLGIGSGLLDYTRRPYQKSYDVFKTIYTPVLVSLEWNKDPYIVGWQKVCKPGDSFVGKVWITNDWLEPLHGLTLAWRLINAASKQVMVEATRSTAAPADSSKITDHIVWPIPEGTKGAFKVEMTLTDKDGKVLSENWFDFEVA